MYFKNLLYHRYICGGSAYGAHKWLVIAKGILLGDAKAVRSNPTKASRTLSSNEQRRLSTRLKSVLLISLCLYSTFFCCNFIVRFCLVLAKQALFMLTSYLSPQVSIVLLGLVYRLEDKHSVCNSHFAFLQSGSKVSPWFTLVIHTCSFPCCIFEKL